MSAPRLLSRRQILRLFALIAGGRALAGDQPKGAGDNGIGGTGFKPSDNGIGGTGFVGTIRRFGSVWVNGEKIAYPSDALIRIDGEPAVPSAMRIGQVARLIAENRDGTWKTNAIHIVSEVVGPIADVDGARLEVLGQTVELPSAKAARRLKLGERVAVSGLRKPDQTIVASDIERRPAGPDQIAGVLTEDADGVFSIGRLRVIGVGRAVVGERVILRGAPDAGVFAAREVKLDTVIALGAPENVSVETWVARSDGELMTAGGVRVEDAGADLAPGVYHVVINGALGANGVLIARELAFPNTHGDFSPPGGGRGPGGGGRPGGLPGGGMSHPSGGGEGPRGFDGPGGLRPGGGFGGGVPGPSGTPSPGFGVPGGLNAPGGFGGPQFPGGGGFPGGGFPR